MNPYVAFWRDPFTPDEDRILCALAKAHQGVALRNNASAQAFRTSFAASGQYTNAVIGALSTLGWPHGPVAEAMRYLKDPSPENMVRGKYPGWGNAFIRGRHDPAFLPVREALSGTAIGATVEALSAPIEKHIGIYPNPACWTAAVAIHVGIPEEVSPYLFVAARLPMWSRSVIKTDRPASPPATGG